MPRQPPAHTLRSYNRQQLGLTTTEPWPPDILQTLDGLWRSDTYMGSIRRSLCPLLGYNPSPEDVRYQAERYQAIAFHFRQPKSPHTYPNHPTGHLHQSPAKSPPTPRPHHPVPLRGFSMLGGRIR